MQRFDWVLQDIERKKKTKVQWSSWISMLTAFTKGVHSYCNTRSSCSTCGNNFQSDPIKKIEAACQLSISWTTLYHIKLWWISKNKININKKCWTYNPDPRFLVPQFPEEITTISCGLN